MRLVRVGTAWFNARLFQPLLSMPIDVYSARHAGFVHPAEERVLLRVVRILETRGLDAVVVINITTANGECDLLVATDSTTLTMEIKRWREPVAGGGCPYVIRQAVGADFGW